MENEAEVIRKQMEDTRTALSEKLEVLESKVADTVKETTENVGETVESVTEAVKDTASTVAQTVQAVTETFNISGHVQRNPWLALGCSAGVGFLLGMWLTPSRSTALSGMTSTSSPSSPPSPPSPSSASAPSWPTASATPAPPEPARAPESFNGHAGAQEPARENPWQTLFDSWRPMFDQLKGLALGATLGIAGQMLIKALPESFRKDLNEMLTGVTKAVGGTPLWGENDPQQQRSPNGSSGSATAGGSNPPAESGARGFECNPTR